MQERSLETNASRLKREWRDARLKAQTDLFFLARDILGYQLVEEVHRPVCNFFVHKDPSKSIGDQDSAKERLLLDPRGHFKTTIDICDVIQWILCFPNARICLMTGTRELATRMIWEVKSHFLRNEKLRTLFPEYSFDETQKQYFGSQDEFITPARKAVHLREPTVAISTIDSVKAGSHYDIIKCDDLVHENNVGTPEQIEKTITAFNYTTPLMEPYGYRDTIGTRYHYSDLYGRRIDDGGSMVFQRSVWTVGEDKVKRLLFPQRFTLEWLEQRQKEDPYLFNCQYMNDPSPIESKDFSEELINAHIIPPIQIPPYGRTFIAWDLGFSKKSYSNYSVGAIGRYDDRGNLFILDIIRGRFSPWELVNAMLKGIGNWRPARMLIEKAAGSELVLPGLELSARDRQMKVPPIDLVPNSPNIKKTTRIGGLHPLLTNHKLYFSSKISDKEQLIREFSHFPFFKLDDIPDAISMLLFYRQYSIPVPVDSYDSGYTIASVYGDGEMGCGIVG